MRSFGVGGLVFAMTDACETQIFKIIRGGYLGREEIGRECLYECLSIRYTWIFISWECKLLKIQAGQAKEFEKKNA